MKKPRLGREGRITVWPDGWADMVTGNGVWANVCGGRGVDWRLKR